MAHSLLSYTFAMFWILNETLYQTQPPTPIHIYAWVSQSYACANKLNHNETKKKTKKKLPISSKFWCCFVQFCHCYFIFCYSCPVVASLDGCSSSLILYKFCVPIADLLSPLQFSVSVASSPLSCFSAPTSLQLCCCRFVYSSPVSVAPSQCYKSRNKEMRNGKWEMGNEEIRKW